jgi:hypothetical protein
MAVSLPIVSEFDGKGISKAIAEFKQLETTGQKAQFALKKAAVPAGIAIAGLAAGLGMATKAAMEDEAAQTKLASALQNTTGATDKQIAGVESLLGKMAVASGVADDQLRPAFANLARGTGDLERSQKLLEVALDISTATGKDLESVTIALSKAENGQLAALQKLGIPLGENAKGTKALAVAEKELTKATEAHDKLLASYAGKLTLTDAEAAKLEVSTNRLAEAEHGVAEASKLAGDFAEDLAATFGGATAANAETAAGKMARLKIQMDETKESIGAALLPVMEKLLNLLMPLAAFAQENTTLFLIFAGVIGGLSIAVLAANAAMKIYSAFQTIMAAKTKIMTAAQTAFNFVLSANPIGLVVIAIAALVAGLVLAYNKSETFREAVQGLFSAVKSAVTGSVEFLKSYLNVVMGFYKGIFNGIATLWNSTIGKLSFTTPSWVPGFGGKGFSVPQIPMLANGGIVTGPTLAMIGERGPEAVIPLNRAGAMGSTTINVYSTLADASLPDKLVNALRQYNRRSGVIDIAVA